MKPLKLPVHAFGGVGPAVTATTIGDLLPSTIEVGAPISPATSGSEGSNLLTAVTETQDGTAAGTVVSYPDAEKAQVVTTMQEFNVEWTVTASEGDTIVVRNLSAAGTNRFQPWFSGSDYGAQISGGEEVSYLVPAGFDGRFKPKVFSARDALLVQLVVLTSPTPGADIDLFTLFDETAVSIVADGLPPGLAPTAGIISASQAATEGEEYEITVTGVNAAGHGTTLTHTMVVTQASSLSSPVIEAVDGGAIVEGATLRVAATYVPGYPPTPREWEWGTTSSYGTTAQFFTVPESASTIYARVRLQGGDWIAATPVSVESSVPDALPGVIDAGAWSLADAQAVGGDELTLTILANVTATPGVSSWQYSLNGGAWTTFASGAAGADLTGAYTISGLTTGVEADVVVRAVNAEGAGPASGEKSATPTSSAAGGDLTADEWTVNSAVSDGTELLFAVDRIPVGATGLRLRAGAVEANADYLAPGIHKLGGLTNVTAYDCQVSTDGGSTWSDVKAATTTAETDTRIAVWSGGEKARQLSAQPSATGSNTIVAVTGGGDVERVRFAGSRFDTRYIGSGVAGTGDWLIYDPLGSMDGLAPGRRENLTVSIGGTTHTLIHFGDAGMTVYPRSPAVFGFDGDGDPVPFRFDRPKSVGRLPDGRPFVVGTVGFVHNGGDPVVVSPDATKGYAIVSDRGAVCCVVARPGIIPPTGEAATSLGLDHAYVRRAGSFSFADWDDSAAASGGSTGVAVRANFESLGIYWAHSGTNRVKVRFRKGTSGAWSPAQDLDYDSRNASGYPNAALAAKHRGVIQYLEPGTAYQIELKDGSTYRRVTASTRSYKPTKASAELGVVDGNVTISRSGNAVTVSRAGLADLTIDTTGVDFAEIHSGAVRRGTISVASGTTNIIIRNVDIHGGAQHGVSLGTGCSEIRVIGGRISGWGRPHLNDPTRWCEHQNNAIRVQNDCSEITALGCFYGSPRYPANSWSERNSYWPEDTSSWRQHPWGASFIGHSNGLSGGRVVLDGVTGQTHRLRTLYDGLWAIAGNNHPGLTTVAGGGPDCAIQWCRSQGAMDDCAEVEGNLANVIVAHNVVELATHRPGNDGARFGFGFASLPHGPSYCLRNLVLVDASATGGENYDWLNAYKFDPSKPPSGCGRFVGAHNTLASLSGYARRGASVIGGSTGLGPTSETNSLFQVEPGSTNSLSGFVLQQVVTNAGNLSAANALDADFRPTGSAVATPGTAIRLSNINDGGPFYEAAPSIGAMRA